ncbi:response regulator [Parvibaculum sp.]|uniref:response regulator n=1 Tax=Parvibaculum sp. TaxID=2024848 RepID=UPI000C3D1BDD|nr:response regulator [Parvibaculum sp.]MAM93984.1 two-component system response regulator [Parvibaculum sp.]
MVTALVADRTAEARHAASHMLEGLGFRVAGAADAGEALALIAGTAPDLVLADARLETAEGSTLLEAIRKQAGGAGPCILHVTMDGAPASIRRAIEAGADDYLVKPYDEALLRFKLAQARTRGRLDAGRPKLRVVQGNSSAGATSWHFGLYGKAV